MEVVKIEGGIAVLLSEHPGDRGVLEPIVEEGPFVTKLDHIFDALLTFLLERCRGGGLGEGVWCWCIVWIGYCPLFLWWE